MYMFFFSNRLIDEEAQSQTPSAFTGRSSIDPDENMNLLMGDQPIPDRRRRRTARANSANRRRRSASSAAPSAGSTAPEDRMMSDSSAASSSRSVLQVSELADQLQQAHPELAHPFYWTPFVGTFVKHSEVNKDLLNNLRQQQNLHIPYKRQYFS